MKILICFGLFYLWIWELSAQNEHLYKQLSQTYLVSQFPYKVRIPVSHALMRFEDSILVDIYHYQKYQDSQYCSTNKQDTTTFLEYSFKKEGWYQIFAFTRQGAKLYQTSILLLYKPQKTQSYYAKISDAKSIALEWKGDAVVFTTDTLIMVQRKKRNYELDIFCTLLDIGTDTLYVKVYKTDKKGEENLFTEWKMIKTNDKYYTRWAIKRRELDKYRLSFFDHRKYWYGSKEIDIQESR